MRERIRINDLSILFICPSEDWGTLERRAIDDCHYLRDIGGNPTLFCIKGSSIDIQTQHLSLPKIYYNGKSINKMFDLRYLLDLKKILEEKKIDIIHCFNLDYVWPVCLLLMTRPQLPLFLSVNRKFSDKKEVFLEKWLLKRVDSLLTLSDLLNDLMSPEIPIKGTKISCLGAGIEDFADAKCMTKINNKRNIIGTFISNPRQIKNLKVFFYALIPLVDKKFSTQSLPFTFMVFTDRSTGDVTEASEINDLFENLKIKDKINLVEIDSPVDAIKKIDIYVSLSWDEPFNGLEILANILNKPTIVPRTSVREQHLNRFPGVGESYYSQDSRDLKTKINKVAQDFSYYASCVAAHREKMLQVHGIDAYMQRVYKLYVRIYSQRLRFVSLKLKSN